MPHLAGVKTVNRQVQLMSLLPRGAAVLHPCIVNTTDAHNYYPLKKTADTVSYITEFPRLPLLFSINGLSSRAIIYSYIERRHRIFVRRCITFHVRLKRVLAHTPHEVLVQVCTAEKNATKCTRGRTTPGKYGQWKPLSSFPSLSLSLSMSALSLQSAP